MGTDEFNAGGNPTMDLNLIQEGWGRNTPGHFMLLKPGQAPASRATRLVHTSLLVMRVFATNHANHRLRTL